MSIRRTLLVLSGALLVATVACHRKEPTGSGGSPSASAAEAEALPPLVFRDDTANALLTWVDDQGDFHVTEHVADVPAASRGAVRIVLSDRRDGTGDSVYVGDLQSKGSDGSYPVKSVLRSTWDELGASKRKTRLEALAPKAAPEPSAAAGAPGGAPSGVPQGQVAAIIYGASWCGPCHQAEALLKSMGVHVTKKDIEESDAAAKEMQAVLRRAHRQGGSIPVIDVMGQVLVGFSESALRAAVARAAAAR